MGKELRRWEATQDLRIVNNQTVELTSVGLARCAAGCPNTAALLRLQTWKGTPPTLNGVPIQPLVLAQRLVAKWNEQKTCEMNAVNGPANSCPLEQHVLSYESEVQAGDCAKTSVFGATKTNGTSLAHPIQLKNKLWAFDKANPYIAFAIVRPDTVSIDPISSLVGGTGSGSPASCLQISTLFDPNHAQLGRCCLSPAAGVLSLSQDPAWLVCKTASCSKDSDCNDNDPCTTQKCQAGGCVVTTRTCCTSANDCADGDPCTTDTCTNGTCGHAPIANCCVSSATCNDGNPCTTDTCNLQTNTCVNTTASGCCTDAQCADVLLQLERDFSPI